MVPLYADDITLYMVNPKDNLASMTHDVVWYGGLSGVTINWNKSVIRPLTPDTQAFNTDYPMAWASGPIRYLGIWFSTNLPELWLSNYGRVVDWIVERVKRWKNLPLSLAGRIAVAKMIILPKLLYLFVNIPLPLTVHFFN